MRCSVLVFLPLVSGCWIGPTVRAEREAWWHQVSAGYESTCGLLGSGEALCWGEISESPPAREFTQVSAGYQHACGLFDGEIACWGNPGADGATILDEPSGDDWATVSTLAFDACATDFDGGLDCWGNTAAVADVPAGSWDKVVVGEYYACALGRDQDLACWGQDDYGEATPPSGSYVDLDVTDDHACALDADGGSLVCWGEFAFALLEDGEYTDLAVGWNFACALDQDGHVTCHDGGNVATLPAPTDDVFVSIDAGYAYVCGVTDEGHTLCWGADDVGETDVPSNPD